MFKSKYVPDVCINPHPRFGTLVANIRSRRGSKVDIQVPLFQDTNTPEFRQHVAGGEGGHTKRISRQPKLMNLRGGGGEGEGSSFLLKGCIRRLMSCPDRVL